jgi:hypothetical protein
LVFVASILVGVGFTDQRPKAKDQRPTSQFQYARLVNIQRFPVAKDGDNYAQAHGGFGSGDRHHNENEKLTGHILKETRECDERKIHGIEHQLNAHEHRDHVSLDHHASHANSEQHGRDSQIP